jgi:hypothetical protein
MIRIWKNRPQNAQGRGERTYGDPPQRPRPARVPGAQDGIAAHPESALDGCGLTEAESTAFPDGALARLLSHFVGR